MTYQIYGGPLDGDSFTHTAKIKRGSEVELVIVRREYLREARRFLTIPVGSALFTLRGGRLEFDRMICRNAA